MPPPSSPPPAVTPSDPTTQPSSPTTTSVQVQITALGSVVNGRLTSVTVQGLTPSMVSSQSPMALEIGSSTYTVDSVTFLSDGTCRLTVLGGIDPNGVAVGGTARVIIGAGTYQPTYSTETTPPPENNTPPPSSTVPPSDPSNTPYGS